MKTRLSLSLEMETPAFGTWISLGSPVVTEFASTMGFDWLLLDLEHGCFTESEVLTNLQAIRPSGAAAIVRVPSAEPSLIARMLDRGADGIMVPHVVSAKAAADIVSATRYAPHGQRGYSRTVRAYNYGVETPSDATTKGCMVMAQIENLPGVEAAEEIAATEGVDVLFVGPADLTHDLTTRKQSDFYQEALGLVGAAAHRHGKRAGILVRNVADIPALKALGYRIFAVDSDLGIMRKGYQETMRARALVSD